MSMDREMSLGKALWFLGGIAAGFLLKEAVEEYMLEQELAAAAMDEDCRNTGEEQGRA